MYKGFLNQNGIKYYGDIKACSLYLVYVYVNDRKSTTQLSHLFLHFVLLFFMALLTLYLLLWP